MKIRPKTALTLGNAVALLAIFSLILTGCVAQESSARHKLDQMLGEAPAPIRPERSQPPDFPSLKMPDLMGFELPQAVDVQENANAYVLRIPLASPQDADRVQVNVSPRRIEVSGQTGSKQGGASVTSSFMQSFTTSQAVLPGQISRKVEKQGDQDVLVVTIPKDGERVQEATPPKLSPAPPSMEPPETPWQDDDNPLDRAPRQVI